MPASEIHAADEIMSPETLTIGFARRFATYKRASMILRDKERLNALLNNPERPVQIIFAGKAHPHDHPGKQLIREIVNTSRMPEFRNHILFIENYDMAVARMMLQGVDVWLNNPRRPEEASGTSGMKAIYNGGLNFSTLDGWWDEAYDPTVGWEIGRGEEYPESQWEQQDYLEAQSLYNVLENDIVPLFYTRGRDGLPREWLARMKNSIRKLAPFFNTHRMVSEYTERYYMPAHQRYLRLAAPDITRGKNLANWKKKVYAQWGNVQVLEVKTESAELKVGSEQEVTAKVRLGALTPDDVIVQAYYGDLDTHGMLINGSAVAMQPNGGGSGGVYTFSTKVAYRTTGNHGVSVRVLPNHEDLPTPFMRGLIRWA